MNYYLKKYFFLFISFFIFNTYGETESKAIEYTINHTKILKIQSSINPATFNYLKENLKKLSMKNGDLAIITLDTPGGLVSTTKEILTLIGSLEIPVAIWITPEGASATSAGSIIASAAHILVMSEGTNIGAATPIGLGKDIEQKDARAKAVNDLVALVRSLSMARGRNPNHFEKMITEAESLEARTALKENVIDQVINNQSDLFSYIEQKEIVIKGMKYKIILSPNNSVRTIEMDLGQKILNIFANPNIAYILLIVGAALLYFELQAPGGFIAGSVGVFFLFLAGIGFHVLPLNIGAALLIIFAFLLFVLEAYITSFGVLTLAGITSLIFGSLFLYRAEDSLMSLETNIIISVVASIAFYVIFIGLFFIKTYVKHKNYYASKNDYAFISKILDKKDNLFYYQIKVRGEIWKAKSTEQLSLEQKVQIINQTPTDLTFTIKKYSSKEMS